MMEPEMVRRERLLLAGVEDCAAAVGEIDIGRLWQLYERVEAALAQRVAGAWYELHVGSELGGGIYSVLAGVAVTQVEGVPVEGCVRVVPAGRYAHFAHRMKDGGFGEAFQQVEAWVAESGAQVLDFGLQRYDEAFDPEDEESILHIYIPVVE